MDTRPPSEAHVKPSMEETLSPTPRDKERAPSTVSTVGGTAAEDVEAAYNEKKPRKSGDEDRTDVRHSGAGDDEDDPEDKYVTGWKLVLIFVGMLMSIFLIALDQTIVATAIPRIASDFNALERVTWVASAYFLTNAGLILTYGQLLRVATTKYVYLVAIVLFEIGSVICGAAPNIEVLIFGRAFAGTGSAGIFVSCLTILATITRIEQRPFLFGIFGAVFGFSSVVGPLMGGAFTDHVSWRWCFYINLPFGAITILSVMFFIKPKHSVRPTKDSLPTWKRLLYLDWIGTALCLAMVTSLLLALQWGGVTKPWSDGSVIACLVVFGVLLIVFVSWEWYMGDNANMPLYMFNNRTMIGSAGVTFFAMLILLCCIYYLPLYYQSAKEHSAQRSGIDVIVYMVSVVVGAIVSGGVINKFGRPKPFLVGSPLISSLGAGLVFWTLVHSPSANRLYGLQVLLGLGVGGSMQNAIIVIQAEYTDRPILVPQATSIVNFFQLVGGILGISIAGTIFGNHFTASLAKYAPNLDSDLATRVRESVTVIYTLQGQDKLNVLHAYSESLGYAFILAIPAGIIASLAGMLTRNFNLKTLNITPGMAA